LKFLHHQRRVSFLELRIKSGTGINKYADAHGLPKFVKVVGPRRSTTFEKVGTSLCPLPGSRVAVAGAFDHGTGNENAKAWEGLSICAAGTHCFASRL